MRTRPNNDRRAAVLSRSVRLTSLPSLLSLAFGLALVLTSTAQAAVSLAGVGRATVTNIVQALMTSGGGSGVATQTVNNITVVSNAIFQQTVHVSGKATFVSNVFFNVTSYSTNSAASETTIDLSKSYRAFATNNNTAFSALAGIETERTNVQSCNLFITNSSASAKTITMSAAFQNMNASEGNTLYNTNVGHLLVFFYPGFGTNFYFKSR